MAHDKPKQSISTRLSPDVLAFVDREVKRRGKLIGMPTERSGIIDTLLRERMWMNDGETVRRAMKRGSP